MLLTFLQLHILLVAAPAFANWALLCPAALGNAPATHAQVVYLVCQNVLETTAPTTLERHTATAHPLPSDLALCRALTVDGQIAVSESMMFSADSETAFLHSTAPFPHATRAP